MAPRQKRFFCFQLPRVERPPIETYNNYAGRLIPTLAVSPEQAASNAIYKIFHPIDNDKFKIVTKYLHEICNISALALDMDELDTPTIQPGLFGGQTSSHQRRDEGRLAEKIAKRFSIPTEGENSLPRLIAREYIRYRWSNP